jgi:DUF4097 and DUF4098 domain-containing protein YvlB
MDFEVKVPYQINLFLKTLNTGNIEVRNTIGNCTIENVNGNIKVQNINGFITIGNVNGYIDAQRIEGDFTVNTVNGKIQMTEVVGSGKTQNENGEIIFKFKQNPSSNCLFQTLNGGIEITFNEKLSADFFLNTLNGFINCDFPATHIPGEKKFLYKINQTQKLRVGKGGPKIKMQSLNGNIIIRKRGGPK